MNLASELRGILTGLALGVVAMLALVSVNVGIPGQELLESLRFHLVVASLPLPLALSLSGARLRAICMLTLLAFSAGQGALVVREQWQRRAPLEARPVAASLSLVSFNVLATNTEGRRIVDYLAEARPDFAVVMEAPALLPYLDDMQATFPAHVGCQNHCDTVLFSRFPLMDSRVVRFGPFQRERLVIASVLMEGQKVTIVGVHLSKPYFDDFARMELDALASVMRGITGPVVLTGDFNAAAWSSALAGFARGADLAPPPTYVATWPVDLGDFGLPIDNMFSRDGALIRAIAPLADPMGSNHRGLAAQINILRPPEP